MPLVWLAVQEVAALNRNTIYKATAGSVLAYYLSINRSTWLRVYSSFWKELKDIVVGIDAELLCDLAETISMPGEL